MVIGTYAVRGIVLVAARDRTVFGPLRPRHRRQRTAALYAGLPIRRTKILVYTLAGLLAGIAGVLYAAENHQGNPNAGVAYELDAIAAVVIGGTALSGGRARSRGTIVGTLIMGVLTNMLRLNNVDSNVEMMIKAVIIVLAVAVQREREDDIEGMQACLCSAWRVCCAAAAADQERGQEDSGGLQPGQQRRTLSRDAERADARSSSPRRRTSSW